MDKFGIFNLINSLLTPKPNDGTFPQSEENAQSSPLSTLVNSLLKQNDNQTTSPKTSPQTPPQTEEIKSIKKPTPLQSSMLSTMKNHDEFIKRVNGVKTH